MLTKEHLSAGPRPAAVERFALALVVFTAVAVCLTRVSLTDTPYHLATARLAFAEGAWPVTNTFSYTHPGHTLYQQYPIYQSLLYGVYLVGGWEGLSVLHCVVWVSVFLLWMRWGGTWNWACVLSLAWLLGLLGLQQRALLRPDMITILLLVCLLHAIDQYRAGRTWAAAAFVVIQWLMANSHQMFPLGLAVQGLFLAHLVGVRWAAGRWGVSPEDAGRPVWPAALALVGSGLACLLTPLGLTVLRVPLVTADSLSSHRAHVDEFIPFYRSPYVTMLVLASAALALLGLWLNRRRWVPFEAALWLLGGALVGSAIRGTVFFVLLSVGIFARCLARRRAELGPEGRTPADQASPALSPVRLLCVSLTVGLSLFLVHSRWIAPQRRLLGVQAGVGRALGAWPDHAIAFLKENPPPGRMMNLSWYSGNALVWGLYPEQRVFIDPRFEAYPRPFLLAAIAAQNDEAVFQQLLGQYQPNWIVAEVRLPGVRQRVAGLLRQRTWALVYADTNLLVLVRDTPASADYLAAHRLQPRDIAPPDFLVGEPDLYGQQLMRMAELFRDLGVPDRADELADRAEDFAGRYPEVRRALESYQLSAVSYQPGLAGVR